MLDRPILRMEKRLATWEQADDRRAVFLDCYARMTRAMDSALERGEFDDCEWVAVLLDRFADHYFFHVDAWERRDGTAAAPWQLAHDATGWDRVSTLQLLLAGVNAHINYDLVVTLLELLGPDPSCADPEGLARRRRDYDRVNAVIAATANEVQDEVVERYAPRLDIADRVLGRVDEWMAVRLLSGWRDGVWRHAAMLLELEHDECARRIDRRALGCERRGRRLLLVQ